MDMIRWIIADIRALCCFLREADGEPEIKNVELIFRARRILTGDRQGPGVFIWPVGHHVKVFIIPETIREEDEGEGCDEREAVSRVI